jgi:hypothetical protein
VTARLLMAVLVLALLPGCRGCEKAQVQDQVAPQPESIVALAKPVVELPKPVTLAYAGPSSKARDGWQISTGFLDANGKPIPQPQAGKANFIYATALDPALHPVGQLGKSGDAEMWGFLVARDLRHALVAHADGPVREGADARALEFEPPAGGDHALLAVFRTVSGDWHAVVSPVSVSGKLPEVLGPGLGGLTTFGLSPKGKRYEMRTLVPGTGKVTAAMAGAPLNLEFRAAELDDRGAGAALPSPFVVLVDPEMGNAIVLATGDAEASFHWQQAQPGDWLVLVPYGQEPRPMMFRLTVPERN